MAEIESGEYHEALAALDQEFAELLPGRLEEIEKVWRQLGAGDWNHEVLQKLIYQVHLLSGSSNTFGYPELGQTAQALEAYMRPWAESRQAPGKAEMNGAHSLVAALRGSAEVRSKAMAPAPPMRPPGAAESRLVYLVEDEAALAKELSQTLAGFDYEVKVFLNTRDVADTIAIRRPDVLVIDIILPEGESAGIELLESLWTGLDLQSLPVVFMTGRGDIKARLAAAHHGVAAYLIKPLDVVSLVDRLDRLTRRRPSQPFRILIVDDDRTLAEHYALVLREAGMLVSVLTEPLEILERLEEDRPELVLMDINMPECSGPELVTVIRQFDGYLSLPIVYLSTVTDLEAQLSALRVGGDDFLTKPLSDHHLAAAVGIRAQRSRDLMALMTRDSLTDLLTHVPLKERLTAELTRSQRSGETLAFAMLDVDEFKRVNDGYGHLVGDRVLRSLATMLRQRVRQSDTVGRYGGEEFGVVLPDCGLEDAVDLIDGLRASFAEIRFRSEGESFHVTFSGGVAVARPDADVDELIEQADRALYLAKTQGRNRVLAASAY